jgi:hypothetical protein
VQSEKHNFPPGRASHRRRPLVEPVVRARVRWPLEGQAHRTDATACSPRAGSTDCRTSTLIQLTTTFAEVRPRRR